MTAAEILTAFAGDRLIAEGAPDDVWGVYFVERSLRPETQILVFDRQGKVVDFDPRFPPKAKESEKPQRGRPKLGVVSREVTLLPRHWEFLNAQPGGASAALRRMIDRERRANPAAFEKKRSQESAYRFMSAVGGDRPNYEEAMRAIFADDRARLEALIADWPKDIRQFAVALAYPPADEIE